MKHLYIMIALFSLCTNIFAAEISEHTNQNIDVTSKNYERFIGIKASLGLGFETSGVYYKESPYYSYDTIDLCTYFPLEIGFRLSYFFPVRKGFSIGFIYKAFYGYDISSIKGISKHGLGTDLYLAFKYKKFYWGFGLFVSCGLKSSQVYLGSALYKSQRLKSGFLFTFGFMWKTKSGLQLFMGTVLKIRLTNLYKEIGISGERGRGKGFSISYDFGIGW